MLLLLLALGLGVAAVGMGREAMQAGRAAHTLGVGSCRETPACLEVNGTLIEIRRSRGGAWLDSSWSLAEVAPPVELGEASVTRRAAAPLRKDEGAQVTGLVVAGRLVGFRLPDGVEVVALEGRWEGVATFGSVAGALAAAAALFTWVAVVFRRGCGWFGRWGSPSPVTRRPNGNRATAVALAVPTCSGLLGMFAGLGGGPWPVVLGVWLGTALLVTIVVLRGMRSAPGRRSA